MAEDFETLMGIATGRGRKRKSSRKRKSTLKGIRGGKDNFTKKDLVKYVAEQCGISQAKAKCTIDATCDFIKTFAGETDSCVTIANFGSFRTKKYKYNAFGHKGTGKKLSFTASKK